MNSIKNLLLTAFLSIAIADDTIWHSYQFDSGHGNREELVISKVDADDYFKTDENVLKWKSLSLKNKSYALGITENGITVLQAVVNDNKNDTLITRTNHTAMNATVFDANIFEYFNKQNSQNEVIAVIACANEPNKSVDLQWYKITDNNHLIPIWKWNVMKNITHLNLFKIQNQYKLLICEELFQNNSSADLYEFTLSPKPNFWLIQTIPLDYPSTSSAVNTFGPNIFLSLPQEKSVRIFIFDENHFLPYKNLTAGHVRYVTSFKIGFQSFLAIDGYNAGIYKFTKDNLIKQVIDDINLDGIDYWLSIPIRTYRDEEILIAERTLDHGSHKSYQVEVLIYNGGKFYFHDEMLCDYYGDITHGMNCLVEESSTTGIKDSAFLVVDEVLGILVPRTNDPSGLFMIHTEIKELESPMEKQIKELNIIKEELEAKMKIQKKTLDKIQESLNHSVKTDAENVISAPWKIETLSTPVLKQENPTNLNESEPQSSINIEELAARLAKLQNDLIEARFKLVNDAPFHAKGNTFKNLIVNGLLEVQGVSNIKEIDTRKFNGGIVEDVFSDIVRRGTMQHIPSLKTFQLVQVDSINFETVNGISADKIAFRDNGPISIEGDIIFEEPVTINENLETINVNDMDIQEQIVQTGKQYNEFLVFENLTAKNSLNVQVANKFPIHNNYLDQVENIGDSESLERIEFNSIFIPGNVTVSTVNNEDFNELISSLCLKNLKTYIPNTTKIEGDVIVLGDMFTSSLNNLAFPQEYVFAKSNTFTKITGQKIFTDTIFAQELVTHDKVNGINPDFVVTLSGNQTIPGKFIFQNLNITESLSVDGNVTGVNADSLLDNPTLPETRVIISNVNFKDLEVEGKIFVTTNFNGSNLYNTLDNVVHKDEDRVVITSVKDFSNGLTVRENLNLISNTINNIPIDAFVSKETEQFMIPKTLNGAVTFENLILTGTFGDLNISKLEQETVKLSGEQYISSKLIFEDEVEIEDVEILNSLNEVQFADYLYTNVDRVLDVVEIDAIAATNIDIGGNLVTEEDNFELAEFEDKRMSFTKEQDVPANFHIGTSKIHNFTTDFINGYNFEDLFSVEKYKLKIRELLDAGKLKIKEVTVQESLKIGSLDGIPMEEILKHCVWTEGNEKKPELSFNGSIFFKDLTVDLFNDVPFSDILANIIFKNETENLEIFGTKFYTNGYEVSNYMVSPLLNGIPVENILRKTGAQEIRSPLVIKGDVLIRDDATIQETLNEIPMQYLIDTFQVTEDGTYIINGDVVFEKAAFVENLEVSGRVNGENVTDFMDNLIGISEDKTIDFGIVFENFVKVEGNLGVDKGVNGVDIVSFKDDVVYITQDGTVDGLVYFTKPVVVREELVLEFDLLAKTVMGIDLKDWEGNSIFINKGKLTGIYNFDQVNVQNRMDVGFLNGIDMLSLIPLKTEQTINDKLVFAEISSFRDIPVTNFVNGFKLQPEFLNSAMSGRIQKISSPVIFKGNVLFQDVLDIFGPINENDMKKLVTTNSPQNLTATYEFQDKTIVNDHIMVYGLINGVNITMWELDGVYKIANHTQVITRPWTIDQNLTFSNNVIGQGSVCGLDIRHMADEVEERRVFKYTVEHELVDHYKKICEDINGIISMSNSQIYLYKYMDLHHYLDFNGLLGNIQQFEFQGMLYLLVSTIESCESTLFVWNQNVFRQVEIIETGSIEQTIMVKDGDYLFLVSRSRPERTECKVEGTNIWKFSEENLILLYAIDELILLQESLNPGTFYGMDKESVTEFSLETATETTLKKVTKWIVPTENAAFVPRGLKLGLGVRNGRKIFLLNKDNAIIKDDYVYDFEAITVGNVSVVDNYFLPGRYDEEMLILNVGYPPRKTLVAVASHEKTSIKGRFDFIKIYDDILEGSMFHKVSTDKPSSMISLEFNKNGETLLVFLEDQKKLQIYEYKGIEGFKQRSSANIEGTKLVPLKVPSGSVPRNFIGVINVNRLTLLEAVMDGDQIDLEKVQCDL